MTLEYVAGSIPVEPLVLTVRDEVGIARSLSMYDNAEVLFSGPDGVLRSGGTAEITSEGDGEVTFEWPEVALFDVPGDYRMSVKLGKGLRADYTTPQRFVVVRGLED